MTLYRWIAAFLAVVSLWGCSDWCSKDDGKENDDVLLLYSAGYNSLSNYLKMDIDDLKQGYVPTKNSGEDVLLVYTHVKSPSPIPALVRIYKNKHDAVVTDTLVVYEKGTVSASADQLGKVMNYVKDNFPAKTYGLIFSSHATGWLPAGYYTSSDKYENGEESKARLFSNQAYPSPVPYVAPEYDPSHPLTKSIGQDLVSGHSYEIELADFAEAIPMHLDYILFDACLMGGVEVAYQLRNVCDKVGFSQAEVLAEGFDYKTLTRHLFLADSPMPHKVCEDFYKYYESQSGLEQSATISCVDCGRLENLAQICGRLFSQYADQLKTLNPADVQRYFRSNYHWFYDLESILVEAGITDAELQELRAAIDECIIYKAATAEFIGISIDTFSGFSMFLPSNGGERLKEFYKTLDWNKATGLVR